MNLYADVGLQYYDDITHSNISMFLVSLISLKHRLYCTYIYKNSIYIL